MENDGDLSWVCSNCNHKQSADLHPYTIKILGLIKLQRAGYPFKANDLTLEEWHDLGEMKRQLEPQGGDNTVALLKALIGKR